jgi:hypothetical protein
MELTKKKIGSEERNYNEQKLTQQVLSWIKWDNTKPDDEIRIQMQSLLNDNFGITTKITSKTQRIIPFCSSFRRDIPIVAIAKDLKKDALKANESRAKLIEEWFSKWNSSIFIMESNQTKTLFKIANDIFYIIIGSSTSKNVPDYKIQIAVAFANPLHAMIFYYKFCFTQNINYFACLVDEKLVLDAKLEKIELEKIVDGDSFLLYSNDLLNADHEVHINYVLSKKMKNQSKRSIKSMIMSLFDILNDGVVIEPKKIKRIHEEIDTTKSKTIERPNKIMKTEDESKEMDEETLLFGDGVLSMGNLTQKNIVPECDDTTIYLPKNMFTDAESKDLDVKILNSVDMNRIQNLVEFSYNNEKKITDEIKREIAIVNCLNVNKDQDPVSFVNNIEKTEDEIQNVVDMISSYPQFGVTHEPFLGNDMHFTSLMGRFLTASVNLKDYLDKNPQIEQEKQKIESQLEERQTFQSQISIPIKEIPSLMNSHTNSAIFAEIHARLMKAEKNAFQCVLLRFFVKKYFDLIKEREYIDKGNFCADFSTQSTESVLISDFLLYVNNFNPQELMYHILKLKDKGCQYVCSTIASGIKLTGPIDQSRLSEVSSKSFDVKDLQFIIDEMIKTFHEMCNRHLKKNTMKIQEVEDMFLNTNANLKKRILEDISKIKNVGVLTEIYEFMMNFHPVLLLFTQKFDSNLFADTANEDSPIEETFKWSYKNVTPKDSFDVPISLDRISSINLFYSTISKNDDDMMLFMKPSQIVFKKSETVLRYDISKWTNVNKYFSVENFDSNTRNVSDTFKQMNIEQIFQYFVDINTIHSIIVSNINLFQIDQQQQDKRLDIINAFEISKYFTLFDQKELEDFIPIAIPNFDKQKVNEKVNSYKTRLGYFHFLTDIVVTRMLNHNVNQVESLYSAIEDIKKKNLLIDCITFSTKDDKFIVDIKK